MRIAVDAMGGDNAPDEIVKGAIEAAYQLDQEIILVGNEVKIRQGMNGCSDKRISIVHTNDVITMSESPVVAVKTKKDSSIVKAVQLQKEGIAAAVVSAGNTGAVMAAGVLKMGLINGIDRPALATVMPRKGGWTLILDVGANVDCKPYHLFQFAIMGYLYAQEVLGIQNPRVGLLNIGEENTKGNEVTLAAYQLLQKAGINFIGNVEGRDIYQSEVNVVVCDGFVGNIVLKAVEGMGSAFMQMLKEEIAREWLARVGFAMTMSALHNFRRRIDYTEYGGAPLLGINGVTIVCHGSSNSQAIKNAIRLACESIQKDLVPAIKNSIQKIQGKGGRPDAK